MVVAISQITKKGGVEVNVQDGVVTGVAPFSVTIPEGVTTIGEGAFANCTSLESIILPEGVTTIEESAFEGCNSLESITLPEGVTTIGEGAFSSCTSLESITLNSNLLSFSLSVFGDSANNTPVQTITIPQGWKPSESVDEPQVMLAFLSMSVESVAASVDSLGTWTSTDKTCTVYLSQSKQSELATVEATLQGKGYTVQYL